MSRPTWRPSLLPQAIVWQLMYTPRSDSRLWYRGVPGTAKVLPFEDQLSGRFQAPPTRAALLSAL